MTGVSSRRERLQLRPTNLGACAHAPPSSETAGVFNARPMPAPATLLKAVEINPTPTTRDAESACCVRYDNTAIPPIE